MNANESPEDILRNKNEQMTMEIRVYNDVRNVLRDIYDEIKEKNKPSLDLHDHSHSDIKEDSHHHSHSDNP
jgi:hypothetical protein